MENSQELILQKIKSPKRKVRATAIECLGKLDFAQIEDELITDLVPLLIDSTTSIKSSILQVISKIGNFDKFQVSLPFLFDALNDNDEDLRNSAVKAIAKYYSENPKKLDLDLIINKIDYDNIDNIKSVVSLLDYAWDADPEKILTTLLILIKFDNSELKSTISEILVKYSLKFPDLILKNLLDVKDDSGFVSKGIITKTIIEITKKNPKEVIPLIYQNLKSDDYDVLLNALASLETLMDHFQLDLELYAVMEILRRENSPKLKIKASQIISKIASQNPNKINPVIDELFTFAQKFEPTPKITLMKSFLEISKQTPDIIPINLVINSLVDDEVLVREISTQILGNVAYKAPLRAKDALFEKSINDRDWAVRDAAIKSLGKIVNIVDEKEEVIKTIIPFIQHRFHLRK